MNYNKGLEGTEPITQGLEQSTASVNQTRKKIY